MRFVLLVIWLALTACAPGAEAAPFGKSITSQGDLDVSLRDTSGGEVRLSAWRGQVIAVVFGYTHCPDYCPTTLARLARVTNLLGSEARFQPIFVTLDPERDTPSVLDAYVRAFHPALRGLWGDLRHTEEVADRFRVLFEKVQEPGGDYTMDHSGGIFLIDRHGTLRLKEPDNLDVPQMVEDIQFLLQEP